MAELPTGTVTFLFTDIEGSTRLLHALGADAYRDALAEHRRVLRDAFAAHGGVEVDTQGDAFFVAFPTASGAAAAAREGTEALAGGPIRVRMGLHTGIPTPSGEGYVGIDVHRGARVAALAHGGQVVLSPATAALVEDEDLRDLGLHRLKDFDGATRLFQLGDGDFPPVRTPGSVQLPTPATRFLGREDELFAAVSTVLERDPRVLTVVGPGGTGKTRFTIELGRLLAEEADGGTVFVALAPLRDADLVTSAVAEALGAPSADPAAVASRIGDARTHIVLDNVEHLLPAAAAPISAIVAATPALRIFASSREPLRIAGETEIDLPPLVEDDAVALFVERSRAVRPDVSPGPAVSELCERLDRLPLALELAAARTKLLAPEALLERLSDRLDALRGTRDADERHATLRATIAWSYDLLDEDERRLFAQLAVFRGGCTVDTAEQVCDAQVDTLASLLDKSLVRRRVGRLAEERIWMLETIREFAAERLAESSDEDAVRRRHAERMLEICETANLSTEKFQHGLEYERVLAEIDDVRAALDWSLEQDVALASGLFVALEHVWPTSFLEEGREYADALLELADPLDPMLRARLCRAAGGAVILSGDRERGEELYGEALALFEQAGEESLAVAILARFAVHAGLLGDRAETERLVADVRRRNEAAQNPVVEPQLLSALGDLAYREGDLELARDLYSRSVNEALANGFALWQLWQGASLAEVELRLGRLDDAERSATSAMRVAEQLHDRDYTLWLLSLLAVVALRNDDLERAGLLWGATSEEEREHPPARDWEEIDELRSALVGSGDPAFLAAVEHGRLYALEDAVEIALDESQTVP